MRLIIIVIFAVSALAGTWVTPTADDYIIGYSTYYRPGLFNSVAENRGVDQDLIEHYVGVVSLNRKGDLFRRVWVQWRDGTVDGPFLNIDCADISDYPDRLKKNRVLEVPAWLAKERGFYGVDAVLVKVWFVEPRMPKRR